MENLVGLCWRCHWNVHHDLLKIEGTPKTGLVFRDAEGRDLARQHELEMADWLDLHLGWSHNEWESHKRKLFDKEMAEKVAAEEAAEAAATTTSPADAAADATAAVADATAAAAVRQQGRQRR
jgi:hypothetical protein